MDEELLLHSLKANSLCGDVRKVFNLCRATPVGRVIDPSYCKGHAEALVSCFAQVRSVPPSCAEALSKAKKCITPYRDRFVLPGQCEKEARDYVECHVAGFEDYLTYSSKLKVINE
jgi:hypothetical protein